MFQQNPGMFCLDIILSFKSLSKTLFNESNNLLLAY